MELHISCDRTDPPIGELRRVSVPRSPSDGADDRIQFSGWLGLLRALADILGDPGDEERDPATS